MTAQAELCFLSCSRLNNRMCNNAKKAVFATLCLLLPVNNAFLWYFLCRFYQECDSLTQIITCISCSPIILLRDSGIALVKNFVKIQCPTLL